MLYPDIDKSGISIDTGSFPSCQPDKTQWISNIANKAQLNTSITTQFDKGCTCGGFKSVDVWFATKKNIRFIEITDISTRDFTEKVILCMEFREWFKKILDSFLLLNAVKIQSSQTPQKFKKSGLINLPVQFIFVVKISNGHQYILSDFEAKLQSLINPYIYLYGYPEFTIKVVDYNVVKNMVWFIK